MIKLLIIVIIILIAYIVVSNIIQYKEKKIAESSRKISEILIEKTVKILGNNTSSYQERVTQLNLELAKAFHAKYSSICTYDGYAYDVKATNVDTVLAESITSVAKENNIRGALMKNVSKYLTAKAPKTLNYKSALERNIHSALITPIFYNDAYFGFWLIEDVKEDAFETILDEDLIKIKESIGVFMENLEFRNAIEVAQNTDKQTGYFSNLYLYSEAKKILTSFENSTISIIGLRNLPLVNIHYGRNVGNALLVRVSNLIKETLPASSILVRYSGTRILVISPNETVAAIHPIMERLISKVKKEVEYVDNNEVVLDMQIVLHEFKKQNNIEKEVQKISSYLANMNEINTIKII